MSPGDWVIWLNCPRLGPAKYKGTTSNGRMLIEWVDENGIPEYGRLCDPQQVETYDRWIEQGGSLLSDDDLRQLAA